MSQSSISNNLSAKYSDETINTPIIKFLIVVLLTLVSLGLIGNILNMIVFGKKKMKRVSTFRFLLYLSLADLLVLLVCSSDALLKFGFLIEIRLYSTIVCKLHTFATYFLTHLSSMILMAVGIDRALVVNNKSIFSLFNCNKRRLRRRNAQYKKKSSQNGSNQKR
jgi:hypothetical protein